MTRTHNGLSRSTLRRFAVSWIIVFGLSALGAAAEDDGADSVAFANSCALQVQSKFNRAITLLHSFEYPESSRLFAEIVEQDQGCAMARWGAAMSIWHPLWAPPDASGLKRGVTLLGETSGLQKSVRESRLIDALRAFYSSTDTGTHFDRVRTYEQRMRDVYLDYLDDPEIAVFYALAVLASAEPHDKTYAHQYRSAGILNWVRETQPRHPGVLHYLIHSYDFPGLAHLALNAALVYAEAAPDSTHAQHMPSHIFTRLGMWEQSMESNHHSTRSAAAYTRAAALPGHYDEGLHSMDYLLYAMLQTGRDSEAKQLLERLGGIKKTDTENFKVAYTYAAGPARYALETRDWHAAAKLELIRLDFPWDDFRWAQSIHHFARGIGAARSGDLAQAEKEREKLAHLSDTLPDTTLPYWREQVSVHLDLVTSWIRFASGEIESALALATSAAENEDSVDKHPVTPGEVIPARELLADMLREAHQFDAALAHYETVLENSPNRLNALQGASMAATRIGNLETASKYQSIIEAQTRHGTRELPGLPK